MQETFFPTLDFTFIGMCLIVFVGFTYFSIMKWIASRVPADAFVRAYLASGGVCGDLREQYRMMTVICR